MGIWKKGSWRPMLLHILVAAWRNLLANRLAREIDLLEGEDLRRLAAVLDEAAARRDPA